MVERCDNQIDQSLHTRFNKNVLRLALREEEVG